jgi:hypothetical protein
MTAVSAAIAAAVGVAVEAAERLTGHDIWLDQRLLDWKLYADLRLLDGCVRSRPAVPSSRHSPLRASGRDPGCSHLPLGESRHGPGSYPRPRPVPDKIVYPLDADLRLQLHRARESRDPSAVAAAQLDLSIREHPLFDSLVVMLRTGEVEIEEPRRMAATAKAALLAADDFAPKKSPRARARAVAELIVHDLAVTEDQHRETTRRALLLARACLPPRGRRLPPEQQHRPASLRLPAVDVV